MNLTGPVSQLAAHSALVAREGNKVQLALDSAGEPFRRPALEERLTQALSAHFGESIRIEFTQAAVEIDTPARQQKAAANDRLANARVAIDADPNVRAMRETFGATVQPESVRPLD
jgi:DNA polymerase-3 subunit gamma/tau